MSERTETAETAQPARSKEQNAQVNEILARNGLQQGGEEKLEKKRGLGFRSRLRRIFPLRGELAAIRTKLLLAMASGVTGAFIFPRYQFSTLAWVALAPYLFTVATLRGRALVWATLAFGLPFYYLSLFWLNTLTAFNPFIPAAVPLLALIMTVPIVGFAFAASWAMRRQPDWIAPFSVAAIWAGIEYLRSLGEIAFPWNLLGHSQGRGPLAVIVNWAEVGGVYLVSFFILIANATLALLARRILQMRWPHQRRQSADVSSNSRSNPWVAALSAIFPFSILMLAFICALGLRTEARRDHEFRAADQTSATIQIAIVQPNISQVDKWDASALPFEDQRRHQIELGAFRTTVDLVRSAASASNDARTSAAEPVLYILPEAAFMTPAFVYDTKLHEFIAKLSDELHGDIFFGADAREPVDRYAKRLSAGFREASVTAPPTPFVLPKFDEAAETERRVAVFNSAWLAKPGEGLTARVYHKINLVPFGEAAPILGAIPWIQEKLMMVGTFQRGTEQTLFETAGIPYGALICFESSFASLARGMVRGGAQMICVLTNDAWYDPSYLKHAGGFWGAVFRLPVLGTLAASGPDQHFSQSIFRAIETRTPVVRAANTGISAVIDPLGRVQSSLGLNQKGVLRVAVAAPKRERHPAGKPGRPAPTQKDPFGNLKLTSYARRGDLFAQMCLLVTGFMCIWEYRARRASAKHA